MLKVWGRRTSSNVQALMWSVGELGLAYERFDVGHRFGGLNTPEFLAMNPNGTIPVLRDDDGEPLWETGSILRYLANRYGRAPYWPNDLAKRTRVDQWAEWSKINVALNLHRADLLAGRPRAKARPKCAEGGDPRSGPISRYRREPAGGRHIFVWGRLHVGRRSVRPCPLSLFRYRHRSARARQPSLLLRKACGAPRLPRTRHSFLR